MKIILALAAGLLALAAALVLFTTNPEPQNNAWPCDYPSYKHLLGQPSASAFEIELPANTRHVSGDQVPTRTDETRLTIQHSGTVQDAKTDPDSRIVGLICG